MPTAFLRQLATQLLQDYLSGRHAMMSPYPASVAHRIGRIDIIQK